MWVTHFFACFDDVDFFKNSPGNCSFIVLFEPRQSWNGRSKGKWTRALKKQNFFGAARTSSVEGFTHSTYLTGTLQSTFVPQWPLSEQCWLHCPPFYWVVYMYRVPMTHHNLCSSWILLVIIFLKANNYKSARKEWSIRHLITSLLSHQTTGSNLNITM